MNKMIPAIVVISLGYTANALVLNGEKITFKTKLQKSRIYKTLEGKDVKLIKFKKPLSNKEIVKYMQEGVESIEYAGELSYYFYAKRSILERLLFEEMRFYSKNSNHLIGYASLPLNSKISKELLYSKNLKDSLLLNVSLFAPIEPSLIKDKFPKIDFDVLKVYPNGKNIVIRLDKSDLKKFVSNPLVKYIEKKVDKIKIIDGIKKDLVKRRNLVSAEMMHVKELWDSPYNLNGEGLRVGVVDGGNIRDTHREFMINGISRVKITNPNAPLSAHATHVAGTIGAFGLNPLAHGMANKIYIYSYYFQDAYFSQATYNLYTKDDIKLSNHSYGYAEAIRLGEYDLEAASQDENIYNHPEIIQVVAAGNDRGSQGYKDYGITKGPVNSKNIFTIGALRRDKKIAYFSSTGPVEDGRVKPDLVTDGWSLYSCDSKSDSSYANMSGTSMATPSATGAIALVMEAYKRVTGKNITADILKAVLLNSAEDLGREGPDYEYGYGLINAKKAVDLINTLNSSSPLLYIDSISDKEEKSLNFYSDGSKDIKITLSWIDPPANAANQSKNLINDIDIKVVGKDKVYYPFTLDKNNPQKTAVTIKANHTDNNEQIVIKNPPKGEYTLVIKGYSIITDKQKFAIASNIPLLSKDSSVIDVDISEIFFKDVKVGKQSEIEEITLKNAGDKDLNVFNISLEGGEFFLDFNMENGCSKEFPFILKKGRECNLGVYVKPEKNGYAQGYIDIINDSLNAPQKRIFLKAKAINSLPLLELYHTLNFDFNDENDIVDKKSGWSVKDGFLKSKKIGNSQSTDYNLKVSVYDNAQLNFKYNISSELDYDLFKFYINKSEILSDSGMKKNVNFSKYLTKGSYDLKWRYQKDYEISLGDDAVYIDNIKITHAMFDSFDFGKVLLGDKSKEKILYLKNAGDSELKVDGIFLKENRDFILDLNGGERACKKSMFSLKPKEYCTFSLYLFPKSEGFKSDFLHINSNDLKAKSEYALKGEGVKKDSSKESRYFSFAKYIYNILNEIASSSQTKDIDILADKLSNGESAFKAIKDMLFNSKYLYQISEEKYLRALLKIVKKDNDNALYNYYLSKLKSGFFSRKLLSDEIFLKSSSWIDICGENSIKPFDKDDQIEAFIERFYNFSLNRDSDEGGMNYWLGALKNKKKNAIEIGIYFFLSPEFASKNVKNEDIVTMLYRTFLNREPDKEGLRYWVSRVENGLSKKDLIAGFAYSKEFSKIALEYGVEAH